MKLLIVSSHFHRMPGGVSGSVYHLGKALSRQGVKVSVVTSAHELVASDDEILVLPAVRRWSVWAIPEVIRIIRRVRAHVVSIQYVPYMYSRYGVLPVHVVLLALIVRLMGLVVLTTFHEVFVGFEWRRPKYYVVAIGQRLIAYLLAACSTRIVASIECYGRRLRPFRRKLVRIPVGSNIPQIALSREEVARLRDAIAPSDSLIIASFRTGAPWARTDLLLRAVRKLVDGAGINATVLILGGQGDVTSETGRSLGALIRELGLEARVVTTGYLQDVEVSKHLSAADLFACLDSCGVGVQSTCLAAAYAAGLPVIGVAGRFTDDVFRDGENIYLLSSLEVDEIAEGLKRLITDTALREKLAAGSRRTFCEHLAWAQIARKYREALNGCMPV
jgi:glycosyltransferase involved in cell wall biosynthesis